jgi:hypothetical protein
VYIRDSLVYISVQVYHLVYISVQVYPARPSRTPVRSATPCAPWHAGPLAPRASCALLRRERAAA